MKSEVKKLFFSKKFISLTMFLLSLVTLFWTKPDQIIEGNDTTYPLNPVSFFRQRLFQWNDGVGAGIDFSHGSAGLTWHAVQALISLTGLPLWLSQKIFLFLLFNAISFSFYFFISKLTKSRIAAFVGTIFYLFNSYLFNLWGNIQSASLCAYALIPLAGGLFLQTLDHPQKKVFWLIAFGLLTLFLSAFAMNPGIIIVVVLYAILFLIVTFFIKVVKSKTVAKKDFIQTVLLFIFVFISFNLFWLVPEFLSVISKGYSLNILSQDNRGWLDFVSANTSLFSVLRLQGEWMWYTTHRGIAYLPYAEIFKNNPFFIILSFLGFFSALVAILKSKNRWIVFFILVLIIGLLACMGSKPPFGYLYLFLAEKTKLLSLLRAPWYKFGIFVCLSYAVLTAFFIDLFEGKKQIVIGFALGLLQLVYAFPLISGAIFPKNSALPFKFKVPDYVMQVDKWLKSSPSEGRIVMLPRQGELDYYYWGNSSSPFLNLLANPRGVLTEPSWTVSADTNAGNLLKRFYDHLESKDSSEAGKILSPLNVKYLILKNDADYNFDQDFGSPDFWRENIDFQEGFKKEKVFGEWQIFSTDDETNNLFIYGSSDLSVVQTEPYLLADYFLLDNERVAIDNAKKVDLTGIDLTYGGVGFLLEKIVSLQPPLVYIRFPADHFLYPFIIKKEEKTLLGLTDPLERINNLMVFSSKRLLEAERVENDIALLKKLLTNYSSNISLVQKEFRSLPDEFKRKEIETLQSCLFRLGDQNERLKTMLLKNKNQTEIPMAILLNSQISEEINQKLDNLISTAIIKKYFVRVEEEGEYQGFLLSSEISKSLKNGHEWKIKINQQELSVNSGKNDQSWIVLNKIPLKKGDNFIEIVLPFASGMKLPFVVINNQKSVRISSLPEISYKKINPAKYEVDVKDAENNFVLVFSQNYHPNWQAKIVGGKEVVNNSKHLKVNGYANGWLIEKKGDFKVELVYKTQKIYRLLCLFTAGLFLSGLIFLLIKIVKWKKNGKNF